MRYSLSIPNFGDWADPRTMIDLARDAEAAGWDGFWVWDHMRFADAPLPVHDPWVLLAGIATVTSRIRIGPMVTPLPRRRPWKVAREAVSLDHLSGGRLMLGVGLGEPLDVEYGDFGEPTDRRVQAEMLDESLAILEGLWSGERFAFDGRHYQLAPMQFLPRPVQRPRIPIIVAGYWPNRGPMRRAARWDGVNPLYAQPTTTWPQPLIDLVAFVRGLRADRPDEPFEIFDGGYAVDDPNEDPGASAALGATWWVEAIDPRRWGWEPGGPWPSVEPIRELIRRGPPRRG